MVHRSLFENVNFNQGTIIYEGVEHPLLDTHFPTIDPSNPLRLTEEMVLKK
jgi:fructose-1,6-bisphosphatase-3